MRWVIMPTTNINGIPMYYTAQGRGIPILFIHPPLLNSENFVYQRKLSDQFRFISFDIRGHGHSGVSKTPLTYPIIVKDMIQLLNYLEIKKCYLCGYSTGGSIAMEAMLTYPDRFYGGILVSAMSEVEDWWLRARIHAAAALSSFKAKNLLSFAITLGNSDQVKTFKNLYREAKKGNIQNMEQYYRYSIQYNCTSKLNQIQSPQLLIYGQKDKTFHHYAQILHNHLPHNELHFFNQLRHQIPTKAHKQMNHLIRSWITKQHYEEADYELPNNTPFVDTFIESQNLADEKNEPHL